MEKKCDGQCKFAFGGVFIVGLVLVGVTANYFLNKEEGEDREARNRRIATEVARFQHETRVTDSN